MGFLSRIGANLDLMQAMFEQTGAFDPKDGSISDPHVGAASSLRGASQRCMACKDAEACQKWLELGEAEGLIDREPPSFCRNQGLQFQLRNKK